MLRLAGGETNTPVTKAHIFVLDVDGRPTLVFDAVDFDDARAICMDDVLRADLSTLTADSFPICSANSSLQARSASPAEIIAFEHAVKRAPPSDEPTMVFLIEVDGVVVVKIDPPSKKSDSRNRTQTQERSAAQSHCSGKEKSI